MDRILPTGDLAIKKVLASEENKDILSGLINDFFDVEAEDLNIASPYNIATCAIRFINCVNTTPTRCHL